jgi:hypothetical protein
MKIMADDALEVWIHDLGANKPVLDRTLVFALPRGLVSSSEATPAGVPGVFSMGRPAQFQESTVGP